MTISETDTTSVCTRNSISDVTFYDSTSFIYTIESSSPDRFPYTFIQNNISRETAARGLLIQKLRDGEEIAVQPFSHDWLIFVVMASIFLYSLISAVSRRFFQDMKRFFLFRGVGDPASRDIQTMFHWQSTLINLVSFFNIALFAFCAADYYNLVPEVTPGIIFWFICCVIIIISVTLRHLVCYITGNVSDESEAFNEYTITVYHSYRYVAFLLFILSVMILYTHLFPVKTLFLAGLIITGILYLIRVTRLFMIFLKKSISIFYLILYLCALEFLPVVVLLKYVTGLF
jgi:Domain of unknown function (DUF4271)